MERFIKFFHKKVNVTIVFLSCLLLAVTGCSLKNIKDQSEIVDNLGSITGTIKRDSSQKGDVIVVRYSDKDGIPVKEKSMFALNGNEYQFSVIPGKHYIAAFIDENKDGSYQPEEHGNYYGMPTAIEVIQNQVVTLPSINISGPVPKPDLEIKSMEKVRAVWNNIGKVVSMDDSRFTRDNYNMGLWRPLDFLDKAEGGLFFLQDYEKNKVPVIFIHGVLGGPTDWEQVIGNLDKQVFHSLALYYPSGIRLDIISDYLLEAVSRLQKKYGFEKFYVVAHSMGGLVTRSFVKKYVETTPENSRRLQLVMTINSPMAGMPAASSGVKHSPIVVPSWRDVEPESDFLQNIHSWIWPKDIPYHLVISYIDDESGDGVVSLQSQSQLKLQSESTGIYVFNNDHVGTLNDNDFHVVFNDILSKELIK